MQKITPHYQIELLPRRAYEVRYLNRASSVGFAFDSQQGRHALGSDRETEFYTVANTASYLPADCDVFSRSEHGGEYLKLTSLSPDSAVALGSAPSSRVASPSVIRIAHAIRRALLIEQQLSNTKQIDQLLLDWVDAMKPKTPADAPNSLALTTAKQIEDYIHDKLGEALDVFNLASAFKQSPGYFSRKFKAAFGQSPYDFIIDRRLCKARSMLKTNNKGITEIALELGFNSHSHMSSVFKKRLGISPKAYRQLIH